MNWGYPRTWDGFKHAITRGQYEAITIPEFTSFKVFWEFIKEQMGHYFADVKMQFSDFLAFFALVPFACWGFVVKAKSRKVRVTRNPLPGAHHQFPARNFMFNGPGVAPAHILHRQDSDPVLGTSVRFRMGAVRMPRFCPDYSMGRPLGQTLFPRAGRRPAFSGGPCGFTGDQPFPARPELNS